jgi:hypothetical protein
MVSVLHTFMSKTRVSYCFHDLRQTNKTTSQAAFTRESPIAHTSILELKDVIL